MLDLLPLEQLSDFRHSLSDVFKLKCLVLVIFLKSADFVESFLHLPIALLDLLLLVLNELHHVSTLTDELLIGESLFA